VQCVEEFVMMTDAQVSHAVQFTHLLSSGRAWSLVNESGPDESAPSHTTPFPSLHLPPSTELSATFDPSLCVTPERTVSSRVPLQYLAPDVLEDDDEQNHRTTKVHFDQTVSVHHLSPECGSNGGSPDDCCLSELNTDVLSTMCNELNTSDIEPISIVASDLRRLSSNSVSLLGELESRRRLQQNSSVGKNVSGDNTRKKKKSKSSGRPSTQAAGSTGVIPADCADSGQDTEASAESECVLARPELNTTLKMGSEIAQLQQQEFDLVAVTKEKISPKLKQQVFEKVLLIMTHNPTHHHCHHHHYYDLFPQTHHNTIM